MRILKFHFVLFIALSSLALGQDIKVNKINQITSLTQGEFYYPKFSPDNSKLYFTSANYDGIKYFDFNTGKIENVTDAAGAGYSFVISSDSKEIIYRTYTMDRIRKIYTLVELDLTTKETRTLDAEKPSMYPPQLTGTDKVSYTINNQVSNVEFKNSKNALSKSVQSPVVIIDNSKIVLLNNGEKKVLAPLGEGNYIWPSHSPDGTKLLFTLAGRGTYVSDLAGKVTAELGYANAPQWSPDGKWIIYMVDKDNGERVTSSDIYVSSTDGKKKIQITDTKDLFEMYPVWSADGKKAAFNSEDGKVFIADLNID